jgi:hypothetical protein
MCGGSPFMMASVTKSLRKSCGVPALDELCLPCMGHLEPEQVTQLTAHPALRKATVGLGSDWKNAAARLPFPHVDTPSLYLSLKSSRDPS